MTPQAVDDYRRILGEVKLRLEAVDQVLRGVFPEMKRRIAVELCYLQFRMICELIAVGSLTLHGDIVTAKKAKLEKTHKSDWIMRTLATLYPEFYPNPITEPRFGQPGDTFPPIADGYLTRTELIDLFNRIAGSELHRGGAKGIMERNLSADFDRINDIRNRIYTLLNRHIIVSADRRYLGYFQLDRGDGLVGILHYQRDH